MKNLFDIVSNFIVDAADAIVTKDRYELCFQWAQREWGSQEFGT